jgi:hypothetical protein
MAPVRVGEGLQIAKDGKASETFAARRSKYLEKICRVVVKDAKCIFQLLEMDET